MKKSNTLLEVKNLCKYFPIHSSGFIRKKIGDFKAVDNVNFKLKTGQTLGIVGESGSGKTTACRTILRALKPTSGKILFRDQPEYIDLAKMKTSQLRPLRVRMQMIFQDPFSSLNPRMTVGNIVAEPLKIHKTIPKSQISDRVAEMLTKAGLKPDYANRYPHAFSGGQRQRIGIARALVMQPELVVCDEAVSALDVSVQAQIINLLKDLQKDLHLTYIFVSHDLSVVRYICDNIAVMYAGRIVEMAATDKLFENPKHPYTRTLLAAVPEADPDKKMNLKLADPTQDQSHPAQGCSYQNRCDKCFDLCRKALPQIKDSAQNHNVACHLY